MKFVSIVALFLFASAIFATSTMTVATTGNASSLENNTQYTWNVNYTVATMTAGHNTTQVNLTLQSGATFGSVTNSAGTVFTCSNVSSTAITCNSTAGMTAAGQSTIVRLIFTSTGTSTPTYNMTYTTRDTNTNTTSGTIPFTIQAVAPTFNTYTPKNQSISDNYVINYSVNVNSTRGTVYSRVCVVQVYNASGSLASSSQGTLAVSNTSTACNYVIGGSDVPADGAFSVGGYADFTSTENANAVRYTTYFTNNSNFTKVSLAANKWTLIYADRLTNMEGVANMSRGTIAYVSKFDSTTKNFTTFTTGLSTNATTSVAIGEAVYVYANATTSVLRQFNPGVINVTVTYVTGWNVAGDFNRTAKTLTQLQAQGESTSRNSGALFNVTDYTQLYNSTFYSRIGYVSYSNTTGYNTFRRGYSINQNVAVPAGYGYWIYVNATANQTRNVNGGWA